MVSGIAKKAVTRVRVQKPEYMKKAPPSPKREYFTQDGGDEKKTSIFELANETNFPKKRYELFDLSVY